MTIDPFSRALTGSVWDRPAVTAAVGAVTATRTTPSVSTTITAEAGAASGTGVSSAAPPPPTPAGPATGKAEAAGDELTFADLLDVINPLQHLPVVGTIYREITGDEIKPPARFLGGALFGGPLGAAGAMVNIAVEAGTGRDIGGHLMALLDGDDTSATQAQTPEQAAFAAASPPTTDQFQPAAGAAFPGGLTLAAAFASLNVPAGAPGPGTPAPQNLAALAASTGVGPMVGGPSTGRPAVGPAGPGSADLSRAAPARAASSIVPISSPFIRRPLSASVPMTPPRVASEAGAGSPSAAASTILAARPDGGTASAGGRISAQATVISAAVAASETVPAGRRGPSQTFLAPVAGGPVPTSAPAAVSASAVVPRPAPGAARVVDDTVRGIHPVGQDRVADIMARNLDKYRQALSAQQKKAPAI